MSEVSANPNLTPSTLYQNCLLVSTHRSYAIPHITAPPTFVKYISLLPLFLPSNDLL